MTASASRIVVPAELAAYHARFDGEAGRRWIAGLPDLAEQVLDRWRLQLDGAPGYGMVGLVLPVRCADGTPAVVKFQPVNEETVGEPVALRVWAGQGAVRLLDHDPATGTLLLERLDASRSLRSLPDDRQAVQILAELLAQLAAVPAPPGLRRLDQIAARMVADAPRAAALGRPEQRRLLATCAAAVRELLPQCGDRLLHWDLHYDNVLAGQREPWLAIDPKPLAGDPAFDLLPALRNRWRDVVATGDPPRAVRRRFHLMVEVLGLDRQRAVGWTLGRVLQNALWDIKDGAVEMDAAQVVIAEALIGSD